MLLSQLKLYPYSIIVTSIPRRWEGGEGGFGIERIPKNYIYVIPYYIA
jgi:hypothetical protein